MDAFDHQFRDQWENRPEPEFHPGDWDKLNQRLHPESRRRFPFWLFLLLPMLGVGGLALWVNQLHHQLETFRLNPMETPIRQDTLIQVSELITRDTIYSVRTVVHRDTVFIMEQPMVQLSTTDDTEEPGIPVSHRVESTGMDPSLRSPGLSGHVDGHSLAPDPDSLGAVRVNENLTTQTVPETELVLHSATEDQQPGRKPGLRKVLHAIRPNGIVLGMEGGGVFPVAKGLTQQNGYSLGIRGAVFYGTSWEVGLKGAYNAMSFEIERFDAAFGVPEVAPPSESFEFMAAEVIRPFFSLDLQARYFLWHQRPLSPFLETGLCAIMTQPYEVLYDFRNVATGVTWTYENKPDGESQVPIQALMGAGLRYRLGSSWAFGLHGQYLLNLSRKNVVPDQITAGGQIQYMF